MRPLLDLLAFGAVLLVELVVRSLPPAGAMALADAAGHAWYALDGRRRKRAAEGIAVACRGGLAVGHPGMLARQAFGSLIRVPVEVFLFDRHFRSRRQMLERCRFRGDWRGLHEDLAAGRGGIFVSGHLGNWEAAAWGLRFLSVPCRVVMRPIDNPWIDRRARTARGGAEGVVPKEGAVRTILRTLAAGGWIGIMADQNAGRGGAFVPFFGLPASTYAAPAVLALRAQVPLYVASSLRDPGRPMRFEIRLRRLPPPPAALPERQAALHLLGAFMRTLEGWVRERPEQYNWLHRRWKTRPAGEAPGPHLPAYAEVSAPRAAPLAGV